MYIIKRSNLGFSSEILAEPKRLRKPRSEKKNKNLLIFNKNKLIFE